MNYHQALHILALPDPPTPDEVKQSFRKMALEYHPDRNPDDPKASEIFRQCAEAYNYLVEHVQTWHVVLKEEGPERKTKIPPIEDFEDIFDDIFGFTREGRVLGYQEPQALLLSLFEMAYGAKKKARFYGYDKCGRCHGSGADSGTHATICTYCFGGGRIKVGALDQTTHKVCPRCIGRGRKVEKLCPACRGFGRIQRLKKQEIALPKGLQSNKVYTLGSTDVRSGTPYSVFVRISLLTHPLFRVDNSNILCEYPLAENIARKGGEVRFPSFWGWTQLKVPLGTRSGDILRLKGQGLFKDPSGNSRGDLLLSVRIVPEKRYMKEARAFFKRVLPGNPAYCKEPVSFLRKIFPWF